MPEASSLLEKLIRVELSEISIQLNSDSESDEVHKFPESSNPRGFKNGEE